MKCPFRLLHAPYDGGCECDPLCGCLVEIDEVGYYNDKRSILACGLVAKGKPVNIIETPKGKRK